MLRPALILLLVLPSLAAGEPLALDLRTSLGQDPAGQIRLVSPEAWRGLLATAFRPARPAPKSRKTPGATVEVLDFLLPEDHRAETFAQFKAGLVQSLIQAFQHPPADHAAIDLGILMATDPAHPETLNPTMVRSLQDRFNALPPEGSPAAMR